VTREWREPDDIAADLASGDAARIRTGLADLREFAKDGDEFELPAFDISLLAPFGDAPPQTWWKTSRTCSRATARSCRCQAATTSSSS